jgi:hypothetical protein
MGLSFSADGEFSAASGPADPAWESDSGEPGGDAGETPENAKETIRGPGLGT